MFTPSIRSNRSFQCFVEINNSHDRKNRHQEFINDEGMVCRDLYDDCCRIRGGTNSRSVENDSCILTDIITVHVTIFADDVFHIF